MEEWKFCTKLHGLVIWLKSATEEFVGKRLVVKDPGYYAEFENGYFWTDDPDVAEALMNHPAFGVSFDLYEKTEDKHAYDHLAEKIKDVMEIPDEKRRRLRSKNEHLKSIERDPDKQIPGGTKIEPKCTKPDSPKFLTPEEVAKREKEGKKSFVCKECTAVFNSGMALGKHKRLEH